MSNENITEQISQMVNRIIADDPAFFLVSVQIKPTHNVKVYLDADTGVSIDRCVKYNRLLYKELEESAIFPSGEFSLEVSSPGLDEPLKMVRQYQKNIGRKLDLSLLDGRSLQGTLVAVAPGQIRLAVEKGKGKKKETLEEEIPFSGIKSAKVMIVF